MAAVIRTILGGGGDTMRLFALAALTLIGLLAAAALSLAPAAADGHNNPELILSLVEDSDNVVPPGSTFNVRAQLRFNASAAPAQWSEVLDGSNLRLSGALDWDDSRIGAAFPIPRERFGGPKTELIPMDGADPPSPFDTNAAAPGTAGTGVWPVAYDSRTVVAFAFVGSTNGSLLVFDAKADPPAQVAKIDGAANEHLGRDSSTTGANAILSRPVAVWDQNDTTAWIFAGAPRANTQEGKLYIYKVTYGASGATVSASPTVLEPPADEYNNRTGPAFKSYYGHSVSISADGQTLAVGASGMNLVGAAYVYSMPGGDGEDWSDITYAAGVKVTPVQIPAWGTSTNPPFTSSSTGRTGVSTHCDTHCSQVTASRSSQFGTSLELSADGQTLVVGAVAKRYASTTLGGSFSTAIHLLNTGAVWVFNAPTGGWSAAPDATAGKTAFATTTTDATSWDPNMHYSPGPAKRVESAAAELTPTTFGTNRIQHEFFGQPANISADGSTVVVTARRRDVNNSRVYIFEQPADGWTDTTSPTATIILMDGDGIANNDHQGAWGTDVNYDGRRVLIEDQKVDLTTPAAADAGVVYVFERPDNGWASFDGDDDGTADGNFAQSDREQVITAPTPQVGGRFSAPLYNNAGTLAVFADTDYYGVTGAAPKLYLPADICSEGSTPDGETVTTCTLPLGNTDVTVPVGTPDGPFTISGSLAMRFSDGTEVRNVTSSLAAAIGTVDELANVEFGFATNTMGDTDPLNDQPYPSVVAPGGSTTLLLKLLNDNGKASARGAAASVLFSTTRGGLSARLGGALGEACDAASGQACQIADLATALTADNSDQIRLTVTHPGATKPGVAHVQALVVSAQGATFETEPIAVTFSGPPAALAISQPPTALLGYAPAAAEDDEDDDLRNTATLVVSATDKADNRASVPSGRYTAKLTGPDGKAVALTGTSRQVAVEWPLREDAADETSTLLLSGGNPQARVTVQAAAAAPLATGEYTLELSAGSGTAKLTATQTFSVTGGAAEVALSVDPAGDLAEGASVAIAATVSDASGAPVPDGTVVTFSERGTSVNVALVLLSSSKQRTRDGQAAVTLRAVGIGGAYVTAEADNVSGVQSLTVAAPVIPETVTSTRVDAFTVWAGLQPTTAAELLATLEGVARVRKWTGSEWISYSAPDGSPTADSVDFAVARGDVLWLAGE